MTGNAPLPYKKTDKTPNLGCVDQSDDIRGGMGLEGLLNLAKFVQEGGTLITEGSTATIFPAYGDHAAASRSKTPAQLFVRGSILRGKCADAKSPIAYGYEDTDLPVYFNQAPVLNAGGGGIPAEFGGVLRRRRRRQRRARPERHAQRAAAAHLAARAGDHAPAISAAAAGRTTTAAVPPDGARSSASPSTTRVRAWCCRSRRTRTTCCCRARSRTASSCRTAPRRVDAPLGKGHVVMFAIRPFWRWQTQGTYSLGLQRDHELERSGRGEEHRTAEHYRRATAAVTGSRTQNLSHRGVELRKGRRPMAARMQLQAFRFEPHLINRLPARRASPQVPPVQPAREALAQLRETQRKKALDRGPAGLRACGLGTCKVRIETLHKGIRF